MASAGPTSTRARPPTSGCCCVTARQPRSRYVRSTPTPAPSTAGSVCRPAPRGRRTHRGRQQPREPSLPAATRGRDDGAVPDWPAYVSEAEDRRFVAELGLLGETAAAGGRCVKAVEPYAAVGGARETGQVEHYGPWTEQTLLEDLNACPVTIVDVGSLRDPDDVAPGEAARAARPTSSPPSTPGSARSSPPARTAPTTSSPRCRMPADRAVSPRRRARPDFGPGVLVSGSTKQAGLAQFPDVTATVLYAVGLPVPDAVAAHRSRSSRRPTTPSAGRRHG